MTGGAVCTEHLPIGLVLVDDGLASAILKESGIEIGSARAGVVAAFRARSESGE